MGGVRTRRRGSDEERKKESTSDGGQRGSGEEGIRPSVLSRGEGKPRKEEGRSKVAQKTYLGAGRKDRECQGRGKRE